MQMIQIDTEEEKAQMYTAKTTRQNSVATQRPALGSNFLGLNSGSQVY